MNFSQFLLCLALSAKPACADLVDGHKEKDLFPPHTGSVTRQPRSSFHDINLNCQEGNPIGASYTGSTNSTTSGRTCQAWSASEPHEHANTGVGDHNQCRNPDGKTKGVWCYTTDPDKRWEYCSVPRCVSVTRVLEFSSDIDDRPDKDGEFTSATLEVPFHFFFSSFFFRSPSSQSLSPSAPSSWSTLGTLASYQPECLDCLMTKRRIGWDSPCLRNPR